MPRASASPPTETPGPSPQSATPAGDETPAAEPTQAAERRPTLLETLTPLSENTEYVNALLFGQEGTGKTTALAHMANLPGPGVAIIVNAEAGLKLEALRDMGVDVDKIRIWPPKPKPGQPPVKVTYNNLERLFNQANAQLAADPGSIKGFGFDSLTELHLALLEGSVRRGMKKAEDAGRERGDQFDVEQSDWGVMTSQVLTLLRRFRDLPCHFGATALERTFAAKNGDSDVDQVGPDLNPGLAGKVLGFFDLCLRVQAESLFVEKGRSETLVTAWTKKTKTVRAKDRENALPPKLPEPTFDRLVAYVRRELTPDQDPGFEAHREIRERNAAYLAEKAAAKQATQPTKKEN